MRSDLAGRLQVHAVESLLTQAFLHYLKAEAWPLAWRRCRCRTYAR
jgi:hypothetical protein